jgi:signal transduction histidine kinase
VARVESQLEAQRRLLADTSHELGNPLTVLRTDLNLLREELDPIDRAEIVAEADKEAERMGRLLDELLQLSAAEFYSPPPASTVVDLEQVASDVVSRMRSLAGTRTLTLVASAHPTVRGDFDRLGQILSNLLENAIRHTAEDGKIEVALSQGGGRARVSVSDSGVGIAAEHLPHIFERFYRVDRARSRSSGGTGLGLAIARMIAQTHGGSLTAQSAPGVGSTFWLDLPLPPGQP